MAGQVLALSAQLSFLLTVRTFVKNALKPVCTVGSGDADTVFLLPFEMVKGKELIKNGVKLLHALVADLLGGEQTFHLGGYGNLSTLECVVKRRAQKCTVDVYGNYRNLEKLE